MTATRAAEGQFSNPPDGGTSWFEGACGDARIRICTLSYARSWSVRAAEHGKAKTHPAAIHQELAQEIIALGFAHAPALLPG